jgi:HNH/Endo VII superfamily nuclease toxin with a HHH motif
MGTYGIRWKRLASGGAGRMARNTYPDFEPVPSGLLGTAHQQLHRLEQQLGGIPMPRDRVLCAPWVGRVYSRRGEPNSYGTSQGWLRNEARFWAAFRHYFPLDYGLMDSGHRLSSSLAQHYGWRGELVGDKLIHHHLENGPLVVALPGSLHQSLHGVIHQQPTVLG